MSRCGLVVTVGVTLLAVVSVSAIEQWPQFRGSNAGVADDHPTLPETWSETENVVWTATIPGQSWSSPVVWEDHVFVVTAISSGTEPAPMPGLAQPNYDNGRMKSSAMHRWVVYDIDFDTGAVRWERELHSGVPALGRHMRNSYASETPVTDGERVYVYVSTIGLVAALDMTVDVAWTTEVSAYDGIYSWGPAASPVLHEDRLFVVNDNATQSFIAAFDKNTGDTLWTVERDEVEGWSTPFVWVNDVRTEVVTAAQNRVRSYALDGTLLWELSGMLYFGTIPTPFAKNGLLYVSSGYPGSPRRPVFAIRPGASGDIALTEGETSSRDIAWFHPRLGSYQTSALMYGEYYYTLLDRGFLLCHDARTGEEVYSGQRLAAGTSFAASPWAYNGTIFLLSEDGDTYAVQAGPEFKLLGINSLNEMAMATPAVASGSLFIRTQSKLYRIEQGDGR